jgi:putative hydrolase of the HAD superfamily
MSDSWSAVFWDIGGVILDQGSVQRGRELFVAGLSVRFDLQPTEASEVWDRELGAYFRERDGNTFRPAHRGYQRAVEAVVGEPVPVDEWLPLATQAAHVAFRPVDGAVGTIRTLAEEGYYLGIISDIDAWEAEFVLTAFGVRELFDHMTTSAEVGRTKPARRD